jgi:hypothetical protein
MQLGAIPPTEIVFLAGLRPDDKTETIKKNAPMPQGNFLHAQWRNKPCRNYQIHIHSEFNKIRFTRTPDGGRHGKIEFEAVVYTPEGETVNSIERTVHFDLKEDDYRQFVKYGFGVDVSIAIPVKGSYFLRVGVHDTVGDQVGAVEFPVDQVRLGVAGAGFDKN